MRVHHLNCATMCPVGGRLVSGDPKKNARLACHCLLIESEAGLILVDTGFGTSDCLHPERLPPALRSLARPLFSIEETARRQIENRGFKVDDVRHILTTHLDLDHAGGLPDFRHATVHQFRAEHDAAMNPRTLFEKHRYQRQHFAHGPKWELYEEGGEPWFGFATVRGLKGLPPEILLVPLIGHTRGHCAVAVDTGDRWLLHCGDAYFFHAEKHGGCPLGLELFQRAAAIDDRKRRDNQARLRTLAKEHSAKVTLFCAHDTIEYEALAHGATDRPRSESTNGRTSPSAL
jgi:glyoxylase-like metal-dependent hydrolase (beta-lactamase superfamily II)